MKYNRQLTLPPDYGKPERATAKFCFDCGGALSFDGEGGQRWKCRCGWQNEDHPQPVVGTVIVMGERDVVGSRVRKAMGPIDPNDSRVVLVKRGIPPFKGGIALPGGYVDQGEAPARAAVREPKEEVGLNVGVTKFLGACNPLRTFNNRFALNTVVMTYLAFVKKDGELGAFDDADESYALGRTYPDLCFSSHKFVVDNWFNGVYGDCDPMHDIDVVDVFAKLNPDFSDKHCVKCSTPLEWSEKWHRFACPDTKACNHVHWNAPVPYWRSVLIADGGIVVAKKFDSDGYHSGWSLPNADVPSYMSPSEAVRIAFGQTGSSNSFNLGWNMEAIKPNDDNRIDIVMNGTASRSVVENNDGLRIVTPSELHGLAGLDPADAGVMKRHDLGEYLFRGSKR